MSVGTTIALRFQRAELESKAALSPDGQALLAAAAVPARLIEQLRDAGAPRDAVHALALMLPHRQTVWWGCLAARLIPDLAQRAADVAAIEVAERWVQGGAANDAEQAIALAEACDPERAPAWVATAAFWAGPSLAPRGQQAVQPAPHLPGVATRTALILLGTEPAFAGRVTYAHWLDIGLALMRGENGRQAQEAVRSALLTA